jgi:hypothetical protein
MDGRPPQSPAEPAQPLTLERFAAILDIYGALPARWPAIERPAALALLRLSEEARTLRIQAGRLDLVLDQLRLPLPPSAPGSRLRRRGTAGARARLQRQDAARRLPMPRIGPAARYAVVALIAFIIGFAAAWPLHQGGGGLLPQRLSEEPVSPEAQSPVAPPSIRPAPAPAPPRPRAIADRPPRERP